MKLSRAQLWVALIFLCTPLAALAASAQEMDDLNEHRSGLIAETTETLSRASKIPRYRTYLPLEVDLTPQMPPVGNQGDQGSCTAWAIAYAARTYHYAKDNAVTASSPANIASPAALYNSIKDAGDCNSGSRISDGLDFIKTRSIPSLSQFPYHADRCTRLPNLDADDSPRFRIDDWSIVDVASLDDIKGQIANGHAVIVSLHEPDDFKNFRGGIYSTEAADPNNAHAITAIGYSERLQAFKLMNSWGRHWGRNGYVWLTYTAFKAMAFQAFTMETHAWHAAEARPTVLPSVIPVPTPIVEPPVPPEKLVPIPGLNTLPENVQKIIRQFPCSGAYKLDWKSQTLSIYSGDEQSAAALKSGLKTSLPNFAINVELRPWPQCEALQTFSDPLAASEGSELRIEGGRQGNVFHNGDKLSIRITTPSFPSFVYLIYLEANGDAVFLLQPSQLVAKQYDPFSKILLGDGKEGRPTITVSAPFGNEMLLLITTASPLFDQPKPPTEQQRDLLTEVRRLMLVRAPGQNRRRISAVALSLETGPPP